MRSGQIGAGQGFSYWLLKFDGVSGNKDKELEDPAGSSFSPMSATSGCLSDREGAVCGGKGNLTEETGYYRR